MERNVPSTPGSRSPAFGPIRVVAEEPKRKDSPAPYQVIDRTRRDFGCLTNTGSSGVLILRASMPAYGRGVVWCGGVIEECD